MYPKDFNGRQQTQVCAPKALTSILDGAVRPGHFNGVTTVVTKLFNMVQPDIAVFGQKDFQQYRVLETMVQDLNLPIKMLMAPIARAEDGLALSSRNQYLTPEQRVIAPNLWQVLKGLKAKINKQVLSKKAMPLDLEVLLAEATQQLISVGFDSVDYLTLVDQQTLNPVQTLKNFQKYPGLVILAVVKCGKTRLLDNILL